MALRFGMVLFSAIAALLFNGCDFFQATPKNSFNAIDITGADYDKDFRLTDHKGTSRTLADFKGKAVMLFFGFTNCPDICPTTLADAAKAIRLLESDRGRVQVLFVTLDPGRDTPDILSQYVKAFDPTFLGLYGDEPTTRKVAKGFRVFYEQRSAQGSQGYSIDHMAGVLVFDPQGRVRLFVNSGLGADKIAEDLRKLLS